eukprot:CAMPEP_0194757308 /NCGR_PEP_ID=MMETSP0323_2-20130528/10831_1 /TAXON_ID=2866 ORGANISM="Crypthecodinium cohnii, Strain Seligo" /NCGR_SAMPLE_ID=MMETSP0323_2 /ASSEMBLY_ACC=CAM_ASM_000346 /LENGTH=291 /DNA_ID=CAMNT_0039677191 /DNA_START=82 /DNA_END=957 /DNA_ORIENTATION=+
MRHFAELACKSVGAYLTGNYVFSFANTTKRTVKLHISEDASTAQAGSGVIGCDYLLTVPPGSTAVEVPASATRIRVSAGFYHAESGLYEVFWTQRPFHWEAGCLITVAPRHSVDANRFHLDVWPGAPLAEITSAAAKQGTASEAVVASSSKSLRLLALPAPPKALENGQKALPDYRLSSAEESLVLPGLQIFARNAQGWVPQTVSKELQNGTLEVTGGGSSGPRCVTLNPEEEPALIRMPPLALLDGTLSPSEASRYIYSMRSTLSQSEQTGSGESSGPGDANTLASSQSS